MIALGSFYKILYNYKSFQTMQCPKDSNPVFKEKYPYIRAGKLEPIKDILTVSSVLEYE